jgi:hypothetical protein
MTTLVKVQINNFGNVDLSMIGIESGWNARSCFCPTYVEADILHNGGKGVVNYIMGPCVFIAMGVM